MTNDMQQDDLKILEKLNLSSWLEFNQNQYELVSPQSKEKNLRLEFAKDYERWTSFFKQNSYKKELLPKALGIKKRDPSFRVLDLTCGLAHDSLMLLSLGIQLTSCERHPLPRLLVKSAFDNWSDHAKERWDLFPKTISSNHFDVVYFDPMFDEEGKGLPKKKMRIFREVIGEDADAAAVAEEWGKKARRLVVKRSRKGKPLLENVDVSFVGKTVRYDVYLNHKV